MTGALIVGHWATLLTRHEELEVSRRPGRKQQERTRVTVVGELSHSELHSKLPTNSANLQALQGRSRSPTTIVSAALGMHDAIM